MSTVDDLQAVADRLNQTLVGLALLGGAVDPLRTAAQPNDVQTYQLLNQLTANIQGASDYLKQKLAQLVTVRDEAKADGAKLALVAPPASTPTPSTPSAPASGYTVAQMAGVGVGGVVIGLGL